MKIYLNILIIMVKICASENSDYDWNVKTVENDRDFSDDLKVQTDLNNERLDLLKNSDKANNIEYYYPNSYYKRFDKSKGKNNKAADDDKEKEQNFLRKGTDSKYEEKPNSVKVESNLNQNKNDTQKVASKIYNNTDFNNNNVDYDYVENHQNNYVTNQNTISNNKHEPEINSAQRVEGVLKNMLLKKHEDLNDQFYDQYSDDLHENNKAKTNNINDQFDANDEPKLIGHGNEKIDIEDSKIFSKPDSKINKVIENRLNKHLNLAKDSFVGTNLFDSTVKKCFSTEDVALLTTRRSFENLIPKDLPQSLLDDHKIGLLMNYFYLCHQIVVRDTDADNKNIAQRAFYDTLGGYLNFYMVPVTKYSFYAGKTSLSTAQQVLILHEESRKFLNTNGNGWRMPPHNILLELKSVHIEPLHISDLNEDRHQPSFCMHLDLNTDDNHPSADNMIVQLPKLDVENTKGFLGNIWLPFKRKRIFDLKSERSAFIVVKFYETLTRCYRFENIDQASYNEKFKTWLVENINLHLSDDEFYPGLGAVLRIYEYLKKPKKEFTGFRNDYLSEIEKEEYRNHKIGNNHFHNNKRTKHSENQEKSTDLNRDDIRGVDQISTELPKANINQKAKEDVEKDKKMEAAVLSVPANSKSILRTLDLSPTQIAIIAVPIVIFVLLILICCSRSVKKRRGKGIAGQPKPKHSSSSSSNLFNSPVRFFYVKKKNAANEASSKKNKKNVKTDKKHLMHSDSSASSSPVRNKKPKSGKSSKK